MIAAILLLASTLSSVQANAIAASVEESMMQRQIPSVVVRVDRDGANVYAHAFGNRDVADGLPANLSTRYQYGSITKQFTGAAILTLANEGKLSLDDPLGKWQPQFAKYPVTLRQMLVHTSGIADYSGEEWYVRKDYTNPSIGYDPLIAWSASQPLRFTPGTKAEYDNAAYTILARVVEKASGMQYFAFLSKAFFQPLHMTSVAPQTFFKIEQDTARGYMVPQPEIAAAFGISSGAALVPALAWNLEQVDGAGFLVGDAADLQKWDDALLSGSILAGATGQQFRAPGHLANGKPTYTGPENPAHKPGIYLQGGLGLFEVDGVPVYGANGGTSGFLAFTATIPSKHLSVTILTNHGADLDNSKTTMPVLRALLK
jgi:CubicO group peptidase (beta-lactamase class C family)